MLGIAWSLRPIAHDDLFWHLRTGEWILTHHAVPTTDPFSYTRAGAPWISHEWGFAVLVRLCERALGLPGVLLFTVLITLGIGALIVRRAALSARPLRWNLLAPLLALALLSCGHELFLRAAWLATLLLAALLLALERWRATGRRAPLALALGIVLVWANMHSNVTFGLAVFALQVVEVWAVRRWPSLARGSAAVTDGSLVAAWTLTWTFVMAVALAFCNPNGVRALLYPLVLSRILFQSGIAWDLGMFDAAPPIANLPLLALGLLFVGAVLLRRDSGARPWEIVGSVVYFAATFRTQRFATEFAVVALPALYGGLARRLPPVPATRRIPTLLAAAMTLVLAAMLPRAVPALPLRCVARSFPEGAVRFLRAHEVRGNLFHNSNQGGYLLWALDQPVFWDGRSDVFASLTREVTTIDFPLLVEHYGIDTLILTPRELRDLRAEVESERWRLVYWDDVSAVYLRRAGAMAATAQRLELDQFRAFSNGEELPAIAADASRRVAALAELESLLATQPENVHALYFAAMLDLAAGDSESAWRRLREAARLSDAPNVMRALDGLAAARARRDAQRP